MNKIKKWTTCLLIMDGDIQIKQHSKVTYLGCVLYEDLSGESMATKVIGKINGRIKFMYSKNRFLDSSLRHLLCNALIQPHGLCLLSMVPKFNTEFKKEIAVCIVVLVLVMIFCFYVRTTMKIGLSNLSCVILASII